MAHRSAPPALFALAASLAAGLSHPDAARAKPPGVTLDLMLRSTVYFTGHGSLIDPAVDRSVAAGGLVTVSPSDAASCNERGCVFDLGFTAQRDVRGAPWTGYGTALTASVTFATKTQTAAGSVAFAPDEIEGQGDVPVFLAYGSNVVTLTIDPRNRIPETDDRNNSLSFTVVVRR